jgi:hypothetical protein
MLGRRSDERFKFTQPIDGSVLDCCDVHVKWSADDEWIAISREGAVAGEMLVLDVDDGEQRNRFTVCVIESRPIIVGGDMRHRIRLQSAGVPSIVFRHQVWHV